jgi:hypothetical protein
MGKLWIIFAFVTKFSWKSNPLSHLQISKYVWNEIVRSGDTVIDATCGNGHDSLFLAKLALTPTSGSLYCVDIQQQAIQSTKSNVLKELPTPLFERTKFYCQCHSTFPSEIEKDSVSLICYNLGYLPSISRQGNVKPMITTAPTTITSLNAALGLIKENGLLSVTAYPGHEGGEKETVEVENFFKSLDPFEWKVHAHFPLNRPKSPRLFLALKTETK